MFSQSGRRIATWGDADPATDLMRKVRLSRARLRMTRRKRTHRRTTAPHVRSSQADPPPPGRRAGLGKAGRHARGGGGQDAARVDARRAGHPGRAGAPGPRRTLCAGCEAVLGRAARPFPPPAKAARSSADSRRRARSGRPVVLGRPRTCARRALTDARGAGARQNVRSNNAGRHWASFVSRMELQSGSQLLVSVRARLGANPPHLRGRAGNASRCLPFRPPAPPPASASSARGGR
jgi:hypothetical protein